MLWPAGLTLAHRFGADLAPDLAAALPHLAARLPVHQAAGFAAAWFLYSLPFGVLVAVNDRR